MMCFIRSWVGVFECVLGREQCGEGVEARRQRLAR